jgi:hypothetical protein
MKRPTEGELRLVEDPLIADPIELVRRFIASVLWRYRSPPVTLPLIHMPVAA